MNDTIAIARGSTKRLRLDFFQQERGGPRVDLTGATLELETHKMPVLPSVSILDAPAGTGQIVFSTAVTEDLPEGRVSWFKVRVLFPSGEVIEAPRAWVIGE